MIIAADAANQQHLITHDLMLHFTIRDVLWLTVVVGLGLAWITQRIELTSVRRSAALNGLVVR